MDARAVGRAGSDDFQKKRLEITEELRSALEGEGSVEEKRAAIAEFRTAQARMREELEAVYSKQELPAERGKEKNTGLERMRAHATEMPQGPRKTLMEAQVAFAEALETFEKDAVKMPPEERREGLRTLANGRRQAMENARQDLEAELAMRGNAGEKRTPANPFQQALEVEQSKLQAALEGEVTSQERREAVVQFRESVRQLQEERRRQIEERRKQEMPVRELPVAAEVKGF